MRSWLLVLLLPVNGLSAWAQDAPPTSTRPEERLEELARVMQEGASGDARLDAAREMHRILGELLGAQDSWHRPLRNITSISVQDDPEGTFRIYSWQAMGDPGIFRHFGYFQTAADPSSPIPLESLGHEHSPSPDAEWPSRDWLGQIYYRILPFQHKGKRHWVLFGFSSGDGVNSRKIAEILRLDEQGAPIFGTPLFVHPEAEGRAEHRVGRVVLDYAAESQVTLNYDPGLDMILFDHLTPFADGRPGSRLRYIPDGTYSGYKLKRGQWYFVEQLATQSLDEAPVPQPVLEGRKGRDIMGRERK